MVVLLVVLTFVALVALDYFVLSKRAPRESAAQLRAAGPRLEDWAAVPDGVFLQPGWTWSRLDAKGAMYLGVHPLLLGLIGSPLEFDSRAAGEHVGRGDVLVRIGRSGRFLAVRSPVAGRVDRVNRAADTVPRGWRGLLGSRGWLYRVVPDRAGGSEAWLSGEAAAAWTRRRYAELRDYLQHAAADRGLGAVLADGGELPPGILAEMDAPVWAGLEDRMLGHGGETALSGPGGGERRP